MLTRTGPSGIRGAITFCAAVVVASIAMSFTDRFSWPARLLTAAAIAWALIGAVSLRWHRLGRDQPSGEPPTSSAAGVGGWIGLAAAFTVFQVTMFRSQPRDVYPTMSSLINDAFAYWPVPAIGFAAWIALGWYILRCGRASGVA